MNEEMKDTRMLPVVAWLCEWMADKRGGVYSGLSKTSLEGLRRSQGEDVLIVSDEPLCRLADAQSLATDLRLELNAKRLKLCAALKERNDAQARLAEKDARIAQLAAHARGKNKALANALKEIETLRECLRMEVEAGDSWKRQCLSAEDDRDDLRTQLEQLQSAPAEPWISVSERLPETGETVLAYYLNSHGKGRRIRAQYIKAWTVEAEEFADPDTQCVEYSEQDDCYYLLQGWYEQIDNWPDYASVAVIEGVITRWMPLPAAPATADSDLPGIPVKHEYEATVKEFGGIVENCHFCGAPTRYWHTGTNNPVCPDCAKKHRVEELPNWLADSDVRKVK